MNQKPIHDIKPDWEGTWVKWCMSDYRGVGPVLIWMDDNSEQWMFNDDEESAREKLERLWPHVLMWRLCHHIINWGMRGSSFDFRTTVDEQFQSLMNRSKS